MTTNVGVPELVVAIGIGLILWAGRRLARETRFGKYVLVVLAMLVAMLIFNWSTAFRPVN